MKHVDFCTACYEKQRISCNPHLSLNPNLTCVVSLYAKKFFNPITYFLPPGIIALECCQGRFDIFYVCLQVPGDICLWEGMVRYFPNQEKEKLCMYRPK